ncbi:MAG: leucine-rich repeat protein [Oscillospiraceae bacterium]|nr:leucine-rich repeat protein [Oscillospiraceae bacterium]
MKRRSAVFAMLLSAVFAASAVVPYAQDLPLHASAISLWEEEPDSDTGQYGEFFYHKYSDHIEIYYFNEEYEGDVVIPDEIDGLPVTTILSYTFDECQYITSMHIPASVTEIQDGALNAVYVKWGLSFGGGGVNSSLKAINVDEENPVYCSVDGVVFTKDKKTLVKYPAGAGSYAIPDGVEVLGAYSFYFTAAGEIVFPESVKRIESHACMGLDAARLELPQNLEYIGNSAFSNLRGIYSLVIPESVSVIDNSAFFYSSVDDFYIENPSCEIYDDIDTFCNTYKYDVDGYREWYFDGTIYGKPDSTAQAYAEKHDCNFAVGKGVHEKLLYRVYADHVGIYGVDETNGRISGDFIIPSEIEGLPVRRIEGEALRDQTMTSVVIPDTVTSIGEYAFWNCYFLEKVTFGNSVKEIGLGAFSDIPLKEITLPESLISIDENAFKNTALTSVTIPKNLTSIGDGAFSYNEGLTKIEVAADHPSYKSENGVLLSKDGTKLMQFPIGRQQTEYTVPDGVKVIGCFAFAYENRNMTCPNKIVLPDSVEGIERSAFENCAGLTELTLSDSLKYIEGWAFKGCYGLSTVTFPKSLERLDDGAFTFDYAYTSNGEELKNTGEFIFLNPDFAFIGGPFYGGGFQGTIVGYENSTAQAYAVEKGYNFRSLGESPEPFVPVYSLGDLDGNGSVNATDAALLLVAAAAEGAGEAHDLTEEQAEFADLNGNGQFEATDAALILMYAAYQGAGGTDGITDFLAHLT